MIFNSNERFQLKTDFQLRGDQPQAVIKIIKALKEGKKHNVLLGATGTGKTFTVANVINQRQKSTLVLSHNKTLAMQLYSELKTFFPKNHVEYFISPFDFYRPEAYLPKNDLYIDKSVKWNLDVKAMRMQTLNALLTSSKVIVVASVAAIYGVLDPTKYRDFIRFFKIGITLNRDRLIRFLIQVGYERINTDIEVGKFLVRGPSITIGLLNEDYFLRLKIIKNQLVEMVQVEPVTMDLLNQIKHFTLFPAQEYVTGPELLKNVCHNIEIELGKQIKFFQNQKELLKAHRIKIRTFQDLENLRELGYCKGIENYSLHLEQREIGTPPHTLLDYFPQDCLIVIDESHITLPQLHGMYLADRKRKQTLVDCGFRLPTALDNRPLKFAEFDRKSNFLLYTTATPGEYEINKSDNKLVEQIIRPTGLLDPVVVILPTEHQIERLIQEIKKTIATNNRVFVLTLTIKMAENLTEYLQNQRFKVAYIHSRLKTFERTKVLINFRKGIFDVVIGINLLREGLDIPEVSLVCILDADKEGFLRGHKSLIQMIGRAARNVAGKVILFANKVSSAMEIAIQATNRRRILQKAYNDQHQIVPKTIIKPIQDIFLDKNIAEFYKKIQQQKTSKLTRIQKKHMIVLLQKKIKIAVKNQDFELAAKIRDMIFDLMQTP